PSAFIQIPSFRDAPKVRARNPYSAASRLSPRHFAKTGVMDSGLALSARPGMTTENTACALLASLRLAGDGTARLVSRTAEQIPIRARDIRCDAYQCHES